MIALAIFIGVIIWATNSNNKKLPNSNSESRKSPDKIYQGSSSGYDPKRQVHWTRKDTLEFREL